MARPLAKLRLLVTECKRLTEGVRNLRWTTHLERSTKLCGPGQATLNELISSDFHARRQEEEEEEPYDKKGIN